MRSTWRLSTGDSGVDVSAAAPAVVRSSEAVTRRRSERVSPTLHAASTASAATAPISDQSTAITHAAARPISGTEGRRRNETWGTHLHAIPRVT
jgi:hypothetical protein